MYYFFENFVLWFVWFFLIFFRFFFFLMFWLLLLFSFKITKHGTISMIGSDSWTRVDLRWSSGLIGTQYIDLRYQSGSKNGSHGSHGLQLSWICHPRPIFWQYGRILFEMSMIYEKNLIVKVGTQYCLHWWWGLIHLIIPDWI